MDRELLGRVAALTPGQQRWLRTVLQSVLTMEPPDDRREDETAEPPRQGKAVAAPEQEQEPRRQGLDKLVSGEGISEDEYPELADELRGIADVADLLREGGRRRRRFGEELMRLFEAGEEASAEEEDGEDETAHFN